MDNENSTSGTSSAGKQINLDGESPRAYGLPHDTWRPSQQAALQQLTALDESGGGMAFAELPTGSGKTGIATGLGRDSKVTVLVHTLALGYQYEREYGFAFVAGRQNYLCALDEKISAWKAKGRTPLASDCHLDDMSKCDAAHKCEYFLAKQRALAARRSVVTYPYMMLSRAFKEKRDGILVADECHHVVESLLDFTEFKVDESTRVEFGLPSFPYMRGDYGPSGKGDILSPDAYCEIVDWLADAIEQLKALKRQDDLSTTMPRYKQLLNRLTRMQLELSPHGWFLRCGLHAIEKYSKFGLDRVPGIFLRALNVKFVAPQLWDNKRTVAFMSATIGNPDALAGELGLTAGDYQWLCYPHPTPASRRPVYDLGFDRMNNRNLTNNPELYQQQALAIATFIREHPKAWRGLVLATSNDKVNRLRAMLAQMLPGRVFMPRGKSVSERIAEYLDDDRAGLVAIDTMQGWGHGLDLRGTLGQFVVIAGVPHVSPVDPYEIARKARVGGQKYQWWLAYNAVVQGVGRVFRGDEERIEKVAAIADGGATTATAMRYYPEWFKESIVK